MRTVVLVGSITIANAINKDWSKGESIKFYALLLVASMAMDVIEFFSAN
jgi:hypothetical protein